MLMYTNSFYFILSYLYYDTKWRDCQAPSSFTNNIIFSLGACSISRTCKELSGKVYTRKATPEELKVAFGRGEN